MDRVDRASSELSPTRRLRLRQLGAWPRRPLWVLEAQRDFGDIEFSEDQLRAIPTRPVAVARARSNREIACPVMLTIVSRRSRSRALTRGVSTRMAREPNWQRHPRWSVRRITAHKRWTPGAQRRPTRTLSFSDPISASWLTRNPPQNHLGHRGWRRERRLSQPRKNAVRSGWADDDGCWLDTSSSLLHASQLSRDAPMLCHGTE